MKPPRPNSEACFVVREGPARGLLIPLHRRWREARGLTALVPGRVDARFRLSEGGVTLVARAHQTIDVNGQPVLGACEVRHGDLVQIRQPGTSMLLEYRETGLVSARRAVGGMVQARGGGAVVAPGQSVGRSAPGTLPAPGAPVRRAADSVLGWRMLKLRRSLRRTLAALRGGLRPPASTAHRPAAPVAGVASAGAVVPATARSKTPIALPRPRLQLAGGPAPAIGAPASTRAGLSTLAVVAMGLAIAFFALSMAAPSLGSWFTGIHTLPDPSTSAVADVPVPSSP